MSSRAVPTPMHTSTEKISETSAAELAKNADNIVYSSDLTQQVEYERRDIDRVRRIVQRMEHALQGISAEEKAAYAVEHVSGSVYLQTHFPTIFRFLTSSRYRPEHLPLLMRMIAQAGATTKETKPTNDKKVQSWALKQFASHALQ